MSKKANKTSKTSNLFSPLTGKNFQLVHIDKLKPYANNARKHSPEQIEKLATSILTFGFIIPVLIDAQNRIIAGHGRVEGAKKAGLDLVPVIRVDHLTEAQKRAFTMADNRLAELAEWDDDLLKIELRYLVEAELNCEIDFDTTVIGFETAQIDNLISETAAEEEAEAEAAEALLAAITEKPPVTRTGDLWILGNQKVLCGDSLYKPNYPKLMGKHKARILCSDAPYNLRISGFVSGKGSVKHREFAKASGEMTFEEFVEFLYGFLFNSLSVLVDGGLVYVFMDFRHDQELQAAAKKCGLKQLNLCVWDKGTGGMGSLYRSQHELIFVYKHGTVPHTNNIMLGKHGRNRSNVWHHPGANMTRQGRKDLKNHPTPKPVPLIMDIYKDVTSVGDIVLDPFLGSGSAILAAEKTKRRCFGIEIDPIYVDLTVRRWQELTGKDAVHAETGLTFEQMRAERQEGSKPVRIRNRRVRHD